MGQSSELPIRVYIEDTDANGSVYHANYLRFMERGRTHMMRNLGVQQSGTFAQDVAFVVHSAQLRFLQPARLDDQLTVVTTVEQVRAASLVFAQQVCLGAGQVACEGIIKIACVGLQTLRARRIPTELLERVRAQPRG